MGSQTALDVDFTPLLKIFTGNFSCPGPSGNVVPLGTVLPIAVLVLESIISRQTELCDGRAAGGVLHFGILAQVSEKNDFVDASASHISAPLQGFTITERSRWRSCCRSQVPVRCVVLGRV